MTLQEIKKEAYQKIAKAKELFELEEIFRLYLGKKGKIGQYTKNFTQMSLSQRKKIGQELNEVKNFIKEKLQQKTEFLKVEKRQRSQKSNKIDITIPGEKLKIGHLHPLTIIERKVKEIFRSLGFSVIEGPEIETEWYNFDALNIPKDHPARDMWDTFWLKRENGKVGTLDDKRLLRTHTSPIQIRYMLKHTPPLRVIAPGWVFRHEATDSSHDFQFRQLEGLMVGENISVANFKAIMSEFLKRFFQKKIEVRFRPSYFPFTEPSFEIDIRSNKTTKNSWLELIGAGMVHPNVFKVVGYVPRNWQGFAFGMGLDRLAMLKYKIPDIRLLYSGDLRFLTQF